jgi:hypothetical protein
MQSDHAQQHQASKQNEQHLSKQWSMQTLSDTQLTLHSSENKWVVFHACIAITSARRMSNSV